MTKLQFTGMRIELSTCRCEEKNQLDITTTWICMKDSDMNGDRGGARARPSLLG
jgi:hypothetical protein